MIVPEALDFTSTTSIGSTVPFACALSSMLRRSTGAVSTVSVGSVLFVQAPSARTSAIAMALDL